MTRAFEDLYGIANAFGGVPFNGRTDAWILSQAAAAHAVALGLERVVVMDYDVHHGNGTQWIFYDDPRVLYISTHQYPYYPGTGAADEVGQGRGAGFTVNVPLEAGSTDGDYGEVFKGDESWNAVEVPEGGRCGS